MSKPLAVLISDVHYSLPTLSRADAAMRQAIAKANSLKLPLIVAGDLHDTKANLRAECVNVMIETFSKCRTNCFILRGNHDQINEKSEEHALNFLDGLRCDVDELNNAAAHVTVVDSPLGVFQSTMIEMIPYHSDTSVLRQHLQKCDLREILIMHQGLTGSAFGEYVQDKTALNPEDLAGRRVISGHYHTRQTIDLPGDGKFDYIGNPYTLNFGEAKDPEKGFQILYKDGSLEFVPTNLPKHEVLELDLKDLDVYLRTGSRPNPADYVWMKIKGPSDELSTITKSSIAKSFGRTNFKLDLIPTDTDVEKTQSTLSKDELLDHIINNSAVTIERKDRLKILWRYLTNDNKV